MEVGVTEMAKGFRRMQEAVEDLSLDVPGATGKFGELKKRAVAHSIVE